MRQLSLFEETSLERDEAIIQRGLESFVEVGNALLHIRDNTLYEKTHDTFEGYLHERWKMARRTGYRYMEAAEVVANVSDRTHQAPINVEQTRPLASLPPAQQREVWDRAVATAPNGKVTAAHVEQVKAEVVGPAATIIVEDVEPDDEDDEPAKSPAQINYEEAAKLWSKTLSEVGIYLTSIERRGGIIFLTRHWTQKHREGHADYLKQLSDSFLDLYHQLKGTGDGTTESH